MAASLLRVGVGAGLRVWVLVDWIPNQSKQELDLGLDLQRR